MDLKKWNIFALLEPDFVAQVKMVCVFGNQGTEAMIVMKNDDVFALGSNMSGCLGLGDVHSTLVPEKVISLCGKGIIGFAFGGGPHVVAYTSCGKVFAWGHNGYSELACTSISQSCQPVRVEGAIMNKVVVEVACGSHHTVVLTNEGEVYAWGQNKCGQVGSGVSGCNTIQGLPRRVNSSIGGKFIIGIACGQMSSIAVTNNGEVYSWGYNGNAQLGNGNNVNQMNPCRVMALSNTVIVKVVCGLSHTLALSDDGKVYGWGSSSFGQLAMPIRSNNVFSPEQILTNIGRIIDIAASHYNHVSACIAQNSTVYMWGQLKGQSVTTPVATPFTSLHEVFACYGSPAVTYKPVTVSWDHGTKVEDSLRNAFDDQATSDLVIRVEDKNIYVHKAILMIRSDHFRSMFQYHWQEDNQESVPDADVTLRAARIEVIARQVYRRCLCKKACVLKRCACKMEGILCNYKCHGSLACNNNVLVIDQFSYPVYKAFLRYLYTDEVDMAPEQALELMELASAYCEDTLKGLCERLIRKGIDVENAALLYSTAIGFHAKDLEEFCFRFSLNHMTAVVQSNGFASLDETTVKNFIGRAAKAGAFKT